MLCAVLNIPQPPTTFSICNKNIGSAVTVGSESNLMQADREAVAENEFVWYQHPFSVSPKVNWQRQRCR
jgi:hypothetical protein